MLGAVAPGMFHLNPNPLTIKQIIMKLQFENSPQTLPYNKVVSLAYHNILKGTKAMLATIEQEELRHSLVREELNSKTTNAVIHEFVSPLLYLRLECNSEGQYVIHYGFEMINSDMQLSNRTAFFTRSVYRLTSKEITSIDIEACVSNDWCITECSALYEYVAEQMKYLQFFLIKHKPTSIRQKQMHAVA